MDGCCYGNRTLVHVQLVQIEADKTNSTKQAFCFIQISIVKQFTVITHLSNAKQVFGFKFWYFSEIISPKMTSFLKWSPTASSSNVYLCICYWLSLLYKAYLDHSLTHRLVNTRVWCSRNSNVVKTREKYDTLLQSCKRYETVGKLSLRCVEWAIL